MLIDSGAIIDNKLNKYKLDEIVESLNEVINATSCKSEVPSRTR